MIIELSVKTAAWDGEKTLFTFSDGSEGIQHFVKGGVGLKFGNSHSLTERQHVAVMKYFDNQNIGKGVL